MAKETKCYEVYLSGNEDVCIIEERYSLYSVPDKFYERLSNSGAARYYHRQHQKAWLADENTRKYEYENEIHYIRFMFDANEKTYSRIADKKHWERVKINE